jgi:SET domain-containing protein
VASSRGHGEFFNHSYTPNARYKHDYDHKTIVFSTIKDIKKGDEITVNYNCQPIDQSPLWFTVTEKSNKSLEINVTGINF